MNDNDANPVHDAMIDRLRQAAMVADPPPAGLAASARAAFGLGRLDEELAELLHDTALEPAGARDSGDSARMVSFGTDEVGADLEIFENARGCDVVGLVSGPVTRAILQTPRGRVDVELDDHGRFRVEGVVGAALRLELTTEAGYTVVTPWVRAG